MIFAFAGSAITKLAAIPLGLALLHGPLNHSDTWVIGRSAYAPHTAQRLADAASLERMERVAEQGHGIVLDLEHWRFTPEAEQQDPALTFQMAYNWTVRHGAWVLDAPALDLFGRPRVTRYFQLLQQVRAPAFDIQAQRFERNPRQYAEFVRESVTILRRNNPGMVILAGLSTNPGGAPVTLADLLADYRATRALVSGYWLNIPSPGSYCPRCKRSDPVMAVGFLRSVTKSW
jgi:hypothetical protein